jgi:hypothetical protein
MRYAVVMGGMIAFLAVVSGCESGSSVPTASGTAKAPALTWQETIQKAVASGTKILEGVEKDDLDSVHDELHDIGGMLEAATAAVALPGNISDTDKREQVAKAIQGLFELLGKLDESMHDGEKIDNKDVAEKLKKGLDDLTAAIK